ncbi:hypothetical protein Sjap_015493 [Stephania japonica]|uniref:Uncharacterized protein n=1 Tax=Stephania japonica TaxID=461633 RepID=A0AAP0NU08_9MAGN
MIAPERHMVGKSTSVPLVAVKGIIGIRARARESIQIGRRWRETREKWAHTGKDATTGKRRRIGKKKKKTNKETNEDN